MKLKIKRTTFLFLSSLLLILLSTFIISQLVGPPTLGVIELQYTFSLTEDIKQEVNMSVEQWNQTHLLLTLDNHPNSTTNAGYKWNMALCDIKNVTSLEILNEDAQGGFNNSVPIPIEKGILTDYGMDASWCNETGGEGYVAFSSGSKNEFPKKIMLKLPEQELKFKLFFGTGSVQLEASANSAALFPENVRHICQSETTGTLHAVWEDTGNDIHYSNTTFDGVYGTWGTAKEIATGTYTNIGVLCAEDGTIYVYAVDTGASPDDLKIWESSDDGANFGSATTAMADASANYFTASCDVGPNNVVQCCAAESGTGAQGWYSNDTQWNTEVEFASGTDNANFCDLTVAQDNRAIIVAAGTDQDDVDAWISTSGWGDANRVEVRPDTGLGAGEEFGVSVSPNGTVLVCIIDFSDSDLAACKGDVDDFSTWNCNDNLVVGTVGDVQARTSQENQGYCIYGEGGGKMVNTSNWNTWGGVFTLPVNSLPSASDHLYDTLHLLGGDAGGNLIYTNVSVFGEAPLYTKDLNITTPTTDATRTVVAGQTETLGFRLFKRGGVEKTTGVTINNITINGNSVFINKTAAVLTQTYDYTDSDNNLAYESPDAGAYPPTDPQIANEVKATAGDYTALSLSDNSRWTSSSTGFSTDVSQRFNFTIAESVDDITEITITWEGSHQASTTGNPRLTFLNVSSSSWKNFSTFNTAESTKTRTFTMDFDDVVNTSDNTLNMMIWAESISGQAAQVSTDFVKVEVSYNGFLRQSSYNGSEWVVNISPNVESEGTYDLFINATHGGDELNETQASSIVYAATDSCTPPEINNNWLVETGDICTRSTALDLGTGHITIEGRLICDAPMKFAYRNISFNAGIAAYNMTANCIQNLTG